MNPVYHVPATAPVLTLARATLVYQDSLVGCAYKAVKVRDVAVHIGPHAQYDRAIFVSFVAKGKRCERAMVDTSFPSLMVLDGWVEPTIPDTYHAAEETAPGVQIQRGRALSLSPLWTQEARAAALATGKVVADYHGHDPAGSAAA